MRHDDDHDDFDHDDAPPRRAGPRMSLIVPAVVVAVGLVLAPVMWRVAQVVIQPRGGGGGGVVDSGARIEIEMLRSQIDILAREIEALRTELASVGAIAPSAPLTENQTFRRDGPNAIADAYAETVLIAARRGINTELSVATPSFLLGFLGSPRDDLGDDCQPITNPTLAEMLAVEEVGPVRVQMLRPALDSLREVFEQVRRTDPDLYARIDTAGSLCVRRIRGSETAVSNHAFGLAVDLNIDGHLDTLGDGYTQLGLTILADFFREAGWIWGAAFGREDSMHFEVSRELLERWRAEGRI